MNNLEGELTTVVEHSATVWNWKDEADQIKKKIELNKEEGVIDQGHF